MPAVGEATAPHGVLRDPAAATHRAAAAAGAPPAIAAARPPAAAGHGRRPAPMGTLTTAGRTTGMADTTARTTRPPSSTPTAPIAIIAAAGTSAAQSPRDSWPGPHSA